MVLVITDNKVTDRKAYISLAKAFVKDVMEEKGCHSMEVCIDPESADRVVYVSYWNAKQDFLNHIQGKVFEKHIPEMGKYYVSGKDTFLELISN